MEITGKVIAALPARSGQSAKGEWTAQDFVIETLDEKYPHKMVFGVWGKGKIERFRNAIGQTIKVSFDIDAHEYNGRWFNNINAFDVRPATDSPEQSAPQQQNIPFPEPPVAGTEPAEKTDDLPL